MGTLKVTNISDGTNSTATTNVVKGSAKAWVNFNGTGTVAIREAYNVGSITDHSAGLYTVNFTNPMPDANFALSGFVRIDANWGQITGADTPAFTSSTAKFGTTATGGSLADALVVTVVVHR